MRILAVDLISLFLASDWWTSRPNPSAEKWASCLVASPRRLNRPRHTSPTEIKAAHVWLRFRGGIWWTTWLHSHGFEGLRPTLRRTHPARWMRIMEQIVIVRLGIIQKRGQGLLSTDYCLCDGVRDLSSIIALVSVTTWAVGRRHYERLSGIDETREMRPEDGLKGPDISSWAMIIAIEPCDHFYVAGNSYLGKKRSHLKL